jgi:cytoskeletal protein CcmA (bactofilin family)
MGLPVRLIYTLLFLLCSFLYATEEGKPKQEKIIILASSEVHNGDFFAWGRSVEISGVVNGDVYAFAEQVIIDGVVNGDLLACGGSIDISGKVSRNCRLLAGQVLLSGQVGNNLSAVTGNLQLLNSGAVGGNVVSVAGNADLGSYIGSSSTLVASDLRVSSEIHKNLDAYVGQMRITSRASIGGNLDYQSNTAAWIEPGATIGGTVTHRASFVHGLIEGTWFQGFLTGTKVLTILMNFAYTFVIGIILVKIFPRNLEAALTELNTRPFKSLIYGVTLLILLPLVSIILLMTILGVPFALALIALNIMGFYTAKVYTIFWASQWTFRKWGMKMHRMRGFFCGLVVYFILTAIPIFGLVVSVIAMLFGLGAGVLAQRTKHGLIHMEPLKK